MAHIERKSVEDRLEIEITGAWGIQDAAALAGELRELAGNEGQVLIDLRQATAIDLACVQVLCAAHSTYAGLPGGPRLRAAVSEAVMKTISDIGIEPALCGAETGGACLFKGDGR
ncbi:MAG TPA: STAS domain-containing protein [Deltaproteobacteria bacterium]|nr:STAS domain-containing protein [Deltaproteobacteria bacterium]